MGAIIFKGGRAGAGAGLRVESWDSAQADFRPG